MSSPGKVDCLLLDDREAITAVAAETIVQSVRVAVAQRGRATLALSGGGTPRPLYELLAGPRYDEVVPWQAVHLLWGDERLVSPVDPASNFGMVRETGLLERPLAGVHRMVGELDGEEAARSYERVLHELWPGSAPALDVAIQGMGEDGHTASLFPGSAALDERRRLVVATEAHGGHARMTLTLPVLENARRVLFLVTGAGKRDALRRVLRDRDGDLPAARLGWNARKVTWLLDREAAEGLSTTELQAGDAAHQPPC